MNTPSTRFCLLAMSLLLMVAMISGCKGKKSSSDDDDEEERETTTTVNGSGALGCLTDDILAQFDPHTATGHPDGHSHAFEIHPLTGMTVSAPDGAFEEDVRIEVTELSDATMQRLHQQLHQQGLGALLFGYDLNAGLSPDEVIPGKYTVRLDLKKMDIPVEIADMINIYRQSADGTFQTMNTHVDNGCLVYEASQNSITVGTIIWEAACWLGTSGTGYYFLARFPAVTTKVRQLIDAGLVPYDYHFHLHKPIAQSFDFKPRALWHLSDDVWIATKDDFGNFNLYFRYSMTENSSQTEAFVKKREELGKRLEELKEQAEQECPVDLATDVYIWTRQEAKQAELYKKLVKKDSTVKAIKAHPLMQNPQSIQDIISATKLANRYCRTEQSLKPLSYEYTVYLTPTLEAMNTSAYRHQLPVLAPIVVVDYSMIVAQGTLYEKKRMDAVQVTMAHETMHVYQMEYINCSLVKDNRFLEATGAVMEYKYAEWADRNKFFFKHYADVHSKEADKSLDYSERNLKELLCYPLNNAYPKELNSDPNIDGGYMLGDFLQFMLDRSPKTMEQIMLGYAYNLGFAGSVRNIWQVQSDATFVGLFEAFCQKYMKEIADRQAMHTATRTNGLIPPQKHSPAHCIMRVRDFGRQTTQSNSGFGGIATWASAFCVKTVKIVADSTSHRRYSLFAVPKEDLKPGLLRFNLLEGDSLRYSQDWYYSRPCAQGFKATAYAAVTTRPNYDGRMADADYVDVVAFYQPEKNIEVKGESNDGAGLLINTVCQPPKELKDRKLITGMQILVTNNKSGLYKGFSVDLARCGGDVKIAYDKIGITDKTDIDVTLQARWYYEAAPGKNYYSPATDRLNYKRKGENEQQTQQTGGTEGDDPNSQENAGEDYGAEIVIDRDFLISSSTGSIEKPDKPRYGHITVTKDHFIVTAPSFTSDEQSTDPNYTITEHASCPAVKIEGDCEIEYTDAQNYIVTLKTNKMSPATISIQSAGVNNEGKKNLSSTVYTAYTDGRCQITFLKIRNGNPAEEFAVKMPVTQKQKTIYRDNVIEDYTDPNVLFCVYGKKFK
ncbi:MAG: hypothetical protein K6G08_06745 [Prevotella sp.]|nr:hypothetical protein [Prevotella sp.]